jgi:hypothetical protein
MLNKNKLRIKKAFATIMILFSLYMLYILISIFLNANVSLTYTSVSLEDIKYIILYSKILIIYIIVVIVILFRSFFKKNK